MRTLFHPGARPRRASRASVCRFRFALPLEQFLPPRIAAARHQAAVRATATMWATSGAPVLRALGFQQNEPGVREVARHARLL